MSRRLRRWTHKFAGESGYQRISGDLEVQGNIIGPSMSLIGTAIDKYNHAGYWNAISRCGECRPDRV